MLKIKNGVPIKLLENYGFKYVSKNEKEHDCYFKKVYLCNANDDKVCYEIQFPDMEIKITRLDGELDNTLYDLIMANLVVKMGDKRYK